MSWIAIAPSPTAEATRFTELARTSPAANTPGHAGLEEVRVAVEVPAPWSAPVHRSGRDR